MEGVPPDDRAPAEGERGEGDEQGPAPATWAGRQAQHPDEPEVPPAEEAAEPVEPPVAEESAEPIEEPETPVEPEEGATGLTSEFDEIERELGSDIAGEEEPAAEATDPDLTVEADTLSEADREAAREAALAGLRARTASMPARTPADQAALPPPPPVPATPAAAASAPPPVTDVGKGPSRRGLWARFIVGSIVIVIAAATATSVSGLVFFGHIAHDLLHIPHIAGKLEIPEGGKPQTILILGSDKRPSETDNGRSDTTILLRIDPEQNAIRLLSIPRDLKVNIPGHGLDKLNAAYTYGGPPLTVRVVKQLTGLQINHVVNIDFLGFADAVNAIGCVYIDSDRHYYIPPNTGVSAIDIQAGYQRMCGYKALEYVRYRHTDNDLVRAARQQSFLREARQEVPTSKLINPFSGLQNELINIFTTYTSSDIHDVSTVISTLKLFVAARSAQVRQIPFPALLGGPTDPYVTASRPAVQQAVDKFLGQNQQPHPPAAPHKPAAPSKPHKPAQPAQPPQPPPPPTMIDATSSGLVYAQAIWDPKNTPFPIYYPTKLVPGSSFSDDSRSFIIDGPGNDVYRGYKLVVSMPTDGYYGYYGVSGVTWKDPPILANPSDTKVVAGRTYQEYWDGDHLRLLAWHTDQGSYWIDNTLMDVLTPAQMYAIAGSMKVYSH